MTLGSLFDGAGTFPFAGSVFGIVPVWASEIEAFPIMLKTKWVVRRTTPTECARLQGMPDWWCNGVVHKDAPEYKMWGNGMALPCVLFVMQGIAKQLRKQLLQKIGGNR